jgi:hypothetical protein
MSGTGFLFARTADNLLLAFATAAHVVEEAEKWGKPIKIRHHRTGEEEVYSDEERAIWIDHENDSAIILVPLPQIRLPHMVLPIVDKKKHKEIGAEVAWVGYPYFAFQHLCFFTGHISAFEREGNSYLIDGVAINGVSGGTVFAKQKGDRPELIGIVRAYRSNNLQGETLPGLMYAQDLTSVYSAISKIKSLEEARKKSKSRPSTRL